MPLPFDATLKKLVQAHPRDWLAALHVPAADPVEVLTPDLSTVTRFADTVLRAGGVHQMRGGRQPAGREPEAPDVRPRSPDASGGQDGPGGVLRKGGSSRDLTE